MRDKLADSNVFLYLFDERKEWAETAMGVIAQHYTRKICSMDK